MEIDITAFFKNSDPWQFSASIAEIGQNAGPITWNNAKQEASESPLLTTEEQLQALRDHVQGMGFGEDVQQYGAEECNALFIQLISGEIREFGLDSCDYAEIDWVEYQEGVEAGLYSGSIYPDDDGRIYYYLGD